MKFILVAALIPVLAPLEWTHWDFPKGYSLGCYNDVHFIDEAAGTNSVMNGCRLMGTKPTLIGEYGVFFEEITLGDTARYAVCGIPVEAGLFDLQLIVWKEKGYPTDWCEIVPDADQKVSP